jgi:hypothetical protein
MYYPQSERPSAKTFNTLVRKILLPILILGSLATQAQSVLDRKLDDSSRGKSLTTVLQELEQKHSAKFYFLSAWLDPITLQQNYDGQTVAEVLDQLFRGSELSYFAMYPHAVVIVKDPTQALLRKDAIENAVREKKTVVGHIFGEPGKSNKDRVVISGRVVDLKTRQPIPHVNIQISGALTGVRTDENGKYTLSLSPGVHVINFSFVNYETKVVDLAAYDDGVIDLDMEETPIMLEEVVIQDQASRELATSRIGQVQLTIQDLKKAPTLLGEVDLVKQVQILPGVTTVGEAATGFNVRGGSVDQNLILYDGMPVFNSSHVFGFFTAFNPEAIRDVSFYRGGIPAEYGSRVSSVLDIQSKDGDFKKWGGNAGIGMITSNLMISGPLKKEKTSIAASVRSTYSNWLIHSVKTNYADLSKSSVFFYDGTLKLSHLINSSTKLSFTGYSSKDAFRLVGDSIYSWSNLQASARLDHQFSPRLTSEFIAGSSSYGYSVKNDNYLTASELSYRITSTVLKAVFNYQAVEHKVNFGWQITHYKFNPGTLRPESPASNARSVSLDKQYSVENAFHVSDEWTLSEKLFAEAGVRIPMFLSFGPASINIYKENRPKEINNVIDTLHFGKFENIKTYVGLEPRISFRWMASPTGSFKLGYNRMYQYLNLVTNTTAVTPVDIWQPSGYYFKPQRADQISFGYFKDIKDKKYGASAEVFYKTIKNILDFKDGAQLILNRHLETDLLQGKGTSYGVETSFTKNSGRLTGSLNYTYSRSFRLITGPTSSESINLGKKYPASYDQPHIVNFTWKYNLSRRYFFTGNFTYHSGRPVTIPLSVFNLENTTVAYFSGRNQYRIPDYHRLDLALVVEGNHRRRKLAEGTWVFSIYNAYGRRNPYTVFFKSSGSGGVPKPYQLSIIGTILPSVSYNVKF